jgi:PD-(D/E)XK nuclease superfamily
MIDASTVLDRPKEIPYTGNPKEVGGLKITFGLDLDGYQDLQPRDRFNESICGPQGFLRLLELRLGLASNPASAAGRIVQYREFLQNAASIKERFYTASFAKDPLAVAETLLRWRDELVLAGWDGSLDPGSSRRIRDLAEVEGLAGPDLLPGFGDRMRKALTELDRRDPKFAAIEVLENRDSLPLLLRRVFAKLGASFRSVGAETLRPAAIPGTDLHKIQEALVKPSENRPIKLDYDGSITFVTAYSEITLAHLAAQLFQRSRAQNESATLIAQSGCSHLDTALRSLDEPVLGLSVRSAQRPVLQTLALALVLRWEPLDPRDLLAFLIHPVSPINKGLRDKLACAVAERPGIGGIDWNGALAENEAYLVNKFSVDASGLKKALKRVEESLSRWVVVPRFDPQAGAPGSELAETCAAMTPWAMTQAGDAHLAGAMAEQFAQLASGARELAAILRTVSIVSRAQLDRLVDQVVGSGVRGSHTVAESGHIHSLTAPGAFLEPAETVLWWDFRGSISSPGTPWTKAEIEQLQRSGVELLLPITRRERENGATLRPVLGARKQLVFMSPRMVGNEPALYHPFRDRIQSLIDGVLPIFDLDRHLTDPNAAPPLPLVAPKLYAFPRLRLAGIRRWWKLSGGQYLNSRDRESFSSSEKFIFNPTAWVLRYKAKLWNGRLLGTDLVCGGRQRGNLLHRLFELVFASDPPIDWWNASRLQMDLWLEKEWQNLLPMEGANLRLPGYKVIAEGLLDEGKRATWVLIKHLRVAGVTKTSANVQILEIPFVGGNIYGFLDLLVENASGQKAVIDLKYGGFKQRSQELSDNLHLQLAVYARLVDQGSPWPEAAFLILGKRALLAQQRNFFPDADIVSSKLSPSGLQACWNEFEVLWKWRRDLLDQGWIECAVSGSDGATGSDLIPNSTSPIQRWQLEKYTDPYDDLGVLTGWEENA